MKKTFLLMFCLTIGLIVNLWAQETSSPYIQKVITAYLAVKNALVKDDGVAARAAAKMLYETIDKVPMQNLSASEHKTWMLYKEKLSFETAHIKGTNDLDHQREHFINLSDNFYKLLKALTINTTDLYYQYCPMANDGNGAYWLSEQEGILNPYFGKKMLKCGSTKETIKGKL